MVYVGSSWTEIDWWSDTLPAGNTIYWRLVAKSSQDVSSNTSRIDFKWQTRVTDGSAFNNDTHTYEVTGIDEKNHSHNASVSWKFGTVTSESYVDVGGSDYWGSVYHADDGTYSETAHVSGTRWNNNTFSDSYTISLPTIPRASSPSVSPNPQTWSSTNTNRITVNTNRKSSGFTHRIRCDVWDFQQTKTGVGASTTFDIPYSALASMPDNLTSFSGSIHTQTYSGSTAIGSEVRTHWTIKLDTSLEHPNIGTVTLSEGNARVAAIVNTPNTFVQGISTLVVNAPLTVTGSYTQLTRAVVSNGGDNQTYTLSGTSGTVSYTSENNRTTWLTITAYDKRGTTAVSKSSWTLLPYAPLTATATVGRTSATGSVAVGQVSGVAYGGDYGQSTNSLTITYKYKEHDATTWTDGAETFTKALNAGQQTYTQAMTFSEEFDYQKQYDVQFTVSDLFSTATYTAQLMQGLPILSWDETEVDVFGDLHIHDRENPYVYQDVMAGFDAILAHYGQKNFFVPFGTVTNSGITFTEYSNGSYKVTGTATANVWGGYGETRLKAGEYILSGSNSTVNLMLRDSSGNYVGESLGGNEFKFTVTSNAAYRCYITVLNGTTVDTTVYPMIRDARLASDAYVPPAETRYWNYKTFSNTSAGVTSGSVRWITIGKICFANFYDVVLTSVSRPHNTVLCTGLPPANTAILFLIQSLGTNYSGMRMRIDTDGTVYFHYTGASTSQQHYGTVFYIIK